ncbi:MAG: DUF350 domain-containing protein [Planctomycetes bacterium]|nr:DUF350 domain-containing protein [Planctomycetota bacterium]
MEQFWQRLGHDVLASSIFGILGIAIAILGFKLFDWLTPKIKVEEELAQKQNLAVAIVTAAVILGICYIAAHVVQS